MLKIVLGNKKYSSWSLRPWLALRLTGAPFEEVVVALDMPDTATNIRKYSPSGRVPALIDGKLTIWESLAICEYLAEKFPQAGLWPQDLAARALARSICSEMHAGFSNLRNDCTAKFLEQYPQKPLRAETQADVDRIGRTCSGRGPASPTRCMRRWCRVSAPMRFRRAARQSRIATPSGHCLRFENGSPPRAPRR
jgi:glutathione S-transferase